MLEQNTSFIYLWYDGKKFYLGVHKGTPDDRYICSSKVVLEEYKKRPENFRRRILAYGTMKEMIDLEEKLLRNRKEKGKWDKYYNIVIAFPNLEERSSIGGKKNRGVPKSEEHRRNISKALKGRVFDGSPRSEKTRLSISKSMQGNSNSKNHSSPEYSKIQSKAMKKAWKKRRSRIGID